jgi:DNA polymerase III alpha subunit
MWNRYNENQLTEGVLKHGPEIISKVLADIPAIEKYIERINQEKLDYPIPLTSIDHTQWYMPTEYQTYDIINFLNVRVAEETGFEISDLRYMDTPEYARKETELAEFQRRNLVQLLRQMKYVVDTLRKNNVVWGVGRGSSVASYVLYLMGVHRINSVKYDIPLNEFFKGENNG